MKILSPKQVKALDMATMHRQDIRSIDLMQRAAEEWLDHLLDVIFVGSDVMQVAIICGPGNNGGDGWAIASLVAEHFNAVTVFDFQTGSKTKECRFMEKSLLEEDADNVRVVRIKEGQKLPDLSNFSVLIDAFLGVGISRPISGYWAALVEHFNNYHLFAFAVDIPSGLMVDQPSEGAIISADFTFTFQQPKLAFFAAEASKYVGHWEVVDIGLDIDYIHELESDYTTIEPYELLQRLQHRKPFSHKGTFGHALLVAGSYGKMGAAILSAKAVLRAGAGLLSVHLPKCGYQIMQIAFPEAMCSIDEHEFVFSALKEEELSNYQVIGVGPGLGTDELSQKGLEQLLQLAKGKKLVIDADAINMIAQKPQLFKLIPPNSILTPHPKEFERLFGPSPDSFSRWELQRAKARELQVIIVLKGAFSSIALPNGKLYFNLSGNPGMATAGTGDVLTGLITGLVAQGYSPEMATQLGVFLHGTAGDLAAQERQQESLIASDLLEKIGPAFIELRELINVPEEF